MKIACAFTGVSLALSTVVGCKPAAKVMGNAGVKQESAPDGQKDGGDAEEEGNAEEKKKPNETDRFELVTQEDSFAEFRKDMDGQLKKVCERNAGKTNILITQVCGNAVRPKNLRELQLMLNLDPNSSKFVFTGHSSSLVARNTSAINPRLILFKIDARDDNYAVMGFVRGEQFAEIIVNNGAPNTPDFFLAVFKQPCNDTPKGCSIGELLTPSIESNWTGFTLYQDDDLKNSVLDCKQCHQPGGVNSPKILRMQELRNPWTHFFRDSTENKTLIDDFEAAHGTQETYAGVPGDRVRNGSDPADLERFVKDNGFEAQPNEFQTRLISDEVNLQDGQPVSNATPGMSAAWEAQYERYKAGEFIAVPYHDVKVTEPTLLQKFIKQYQDYRTGVVKEEQMEDHRKIFKTDPVQRANMGFGVRPGEPAETILMQACAQCHNSKLDQSISRSRFDVDPEALLKRVGGPKEAAEEMTVAIARVKLGLSPERLKEEIRFETADGQPTEVKHKGEHIKTMPPMLFRELSDEQIDALVEYFETQRKNYLKMAEGSP